jgi:hypothetical protein
MKSVVIGMNNMRREMSCYAVAVKLAENIENGLDELREHHVMSEFAQHSATTCDRFYSMGINFSRLLI